MQIYFHSQYSQTEPITRVAIMHDDLQSMRIFDIDTQVRSFLILFFFSMIRTTFAMTVLQKAALK